jgi:serine protease AprX
MTIMKMISASTQSRRRPPILMLAAVLALFIAPAIGIRGAGHRAHLSNDLLKHESRHSTARVNVIVHGSKDTIATVANQHHLSIVKWLDDAAVLRANSAEVTELASDAALDNISGDAVVSTGMSISNGATGADLTRAGTSGLLGIGAISGVTGQGIGVAVIDSGITPHAALKNKIVANISFVTNDPSVNDAYGHGTHVAGIIAGSATSVTSLYTSGIAPGVQLINVRVLGANGAGYTSDVIAGINWAVANRFRYNIRVINLSLGHPVTESASTDPLCQAVDRAVSAGIVVVAAAGNQGRAPNGARELGGIISPGNSPNALTVGAVNTWGTVNRGDDTVADFSSRGPTKYDFAVKPDFAAPGSSIISLQAAGAYLPAKYPFLHIAGSGNNAYMRLSGTSMAAPMASGAVALLLQGSPSLSPAQVKLALQSGSSYLPDGGLTGGGAGNMNVWVSRKIAANGLASLLTSVVNTLIGGLITPPSGASFWDGGSLSHNLYRGTGIRLLSSLDLLHVWLDPSLLKFGQLNLAGLLNPLSSVPPGQMMYGGLSRGASDGDEIIWGSTVYDSSSGQNVVWGSSADGDEIIWGSSNNDTLTSENPQ